MYKPLVEAVSDDGKLALQIINVVMFVVLAAANSLSYLLPVDIGDIPGLISVGIAPDGYAFSIWGVNYTLEFLFVVY